MFVLGAAVSAALMSYGGIERVYEKYGVSESIVSNNVERAWDWLMGTWHEKTGMLYGGRTEDVEKSESFTNGVLVWRKGLKHGYGAYISDCALVGGVSLAMLCDKYSVTKEERVKADARKVVKGLLNLERLHGHRGYVARGICAEDGKGICTISSRDQLTHWAHGLWLYYRADWADVDLKDEIRDSMRHVAERMEG